MSGRSGMSGRALLSGWAAASLLQFLAATNAIPLPQPRPIIGIITEPVPSFITGNFSAKLNADYVKWIEGAGGRVAPVPHTATPAQLDSLFDSINGLLFPGGPDILNHTQYFAAGRYLFDKALKANANGDHFTVWGTCLGFQELLVLQARGDVSILTEVDAENFTTPTKFTPEAPKSRMFSSFTPEAYQIIDRGEPVLEQYHHLGVTPATFHARNMSSMFAVLSTNLDRKGVEFLSAIEAHDMPIYGVQYHPERSLFEWTISEDVSHGAHAVLVAQQFSNFFVAETRKSRHCFPSVAAENAALIYNWSKDIHDVGKYHPGANQYYLFDNTTLEHVLSQGV